MKKILCLILALLLTGCGAAKENPAPPELRGTLSVRYLPGGALVQCNGENLLVDCGGNITAKTLKGYGVEKLSALVLTGSGKEEGLEDVLASFPTTVYRPGETKNGSTFFLDCALAELLAPAPDSLGLKLTFGEDRFVFLGAVGEEVSALEKETVSCSVLWLDEEAAVTEELLAAAAPVHIVVDGKADEGLKERYDVFDSDGFGPLTVETEGAGVRVSLNLFASDSVASAGG